MPATNPASKGAEKEVPLNDPIVPDGWTPIVDKPIATTSGLIRKSKDGPIELNETRIPVRSTAPTLKMESASAGAEMYFHETLP
jgi:hypothetical protein